MSLRKTLVAFTLVSALCPFAWCQSNTQLFPLADIKPGLKGIGRTIFQGEHIEEFQVEILGVLKNVLAPKRDLIMARLSGGPLEKTGVIAGMSGSPVYIDGKLVGAVAISFPFSKEPLAGITPIQQMVQVVPEEKGQPPTHAALPLGFRLAATTNDLRENARLIPEQIRSRNSSSILPGGRSGHLIPQRGDTAAVWRLRRRGRGTVHGAVPADGL